MTQQPLRGEVWDGDLDLVQGHEQGGRRPLLVVSTNPFNRGPATLIFVLPITRTGRPVPAHLPVDPPEGGLTARSYILCDALRSISKARLRAYRGQMTPATLALAEDALRILLQL